MLWPQIVDVSDKGQVLIPVDIRRALGIKSRGQVLAVPDKKRRKLVISAIKGENIVEATYGMLASQDGRSWTSELLEEREQDLIQEEK